LGGEQSRVCGNREDAGFIVEVRDGRHFGGSGDDAKGGILGRLKFREIRFGEERGPDRSSVVRYGADQGFEGGENGFFVPAPV
jgi:hypothetical protein